MVVFPKVKAETVPKKTLVDKTSKLIIGKTSKLKRLLKKNDTKEALQLCRNVLQMIQDRKADFNVTRAKEVSINTALT